MDRLATIQGQTIVEKTVRLSIKLMIESIDRLDLFHGQKIVETTVRFSVN